MRYISAATLVALAVLSAPTQAQRAPALAFTPEDMLNVVTPSVLDVTADGRRVAVASRRPFDNAEVDNARFGDPTYVAPARVRLLAIDTQTGSADAPFNNLVNLRQAVWAHDGVRLAVLMADNGSSEDRPETRLFVWQADRRTLEEVPLRGSRPIAATSDLQWSADDRQLIVTVRASDRDREAHARFKALTDGQRGVIVHSSKEPFLDWDALQRANRLSEIAGVDPATGEVHLLTPETKITSYHAPRDGGPVGILEDVTEKTDYDVIGGTSNAVRVLDNGSGALRTVADAAQIKTAQVKWSEDGRAFAYAKSGELFVQRIDDAKPKSLTPEVAKPAGDAPKPDGEKESFSVVSFSHDGAKLLATSKHGWYVFTIATGERDRVLSLDAEHEARNPRVAPVEWSPSGDAVFLTYSEPDRWNRGLMRLQLADHRLATLVKDAQLYGGFKMSRDGRTFVFTRSDGDRPADVYVADAGFTSVRRLTDLNPWLAGRALPKSELVAYRDADGTELYGVLRYPVDYVKGRTYPTIFELYETFFDNGFNARAAFLANHGYAVFHPSVHLVVGKPGEAWMKGVTAAANKLIDMGVADADRLGVQGTSYGGYATVLLLTQTERFKAAVNVSGKVDMVSFYTDSPRLGVRNTHAPEKSQDRIGGTLWDYPERYLDHSAILHADRIKTPLLCITGDLDPNVPSSQSREIYYALRRLGREVEWVRYTHGAHRPPNSAAESIDFEGRILAWYDTHLQPLSKTKTKTEASARRP